MTKRILATMLAVLMVFSALMLAACTNSTPANTRRYAVDLRDADAPAAHRCRLE